MEMKSTSTNKPKQKFIVYSYPRSGRGLFKFLLEDQGLTVQAQDHTTKRDQDADVWITHDFQGIEEADGRQPIRLWRNPVYATVSWFELDVANGAPDTEAAFHNKVQQALPYWKRFHQKHQGNEYWLIDFFDLAGEHVRYTQQKVVRELLERFGYDYKSIGVRQANPQRDLTKFKYNNTQAFQFLLKHYKL